MSEEVANETTSPPNNNNEEPLVTLAARDSRTSSTSSDSILVLRCSGCHVNVKSTKAYWCQKCAYTLCGRCHNNEHFDHDARPWSAQRLLASTAQALDARCSERTRLVDVEKSRVTKLLHEIEKLIGAKLDERLECHNGADRTKIALINSMLSTGDFRLSNDSGVYNCTDAESSIEPHLYHITNKDRLASWKHQVDDLTLARMIEQCALQLPLNELNDSRNAAPSLAHTEWLDVIPRNLTPAKGAELLMCANTAHKLSDVSSRSSLRVPLEPAVHVTNGYDEADAAIAYEPPARAYADSIRHAIIKVRDEKEKSPEYSSIDRDVVKAANKVPPAYSEGRQTPAGQEYSMSLPLNGSVSVGDASCSAIDPHVVQYHFGEEILQRPLDIIVLPHDRILVTDSLNGIQQQSAYIFNRQGRQQSHIAFGCRREYSVSSVAYCASIQKLYFSVMSKTDRNVWIFDVADGKMDKIDTVACPPTPHIEHSRIRYLATTVSGDLYCIAGDSKRSALWQHKPMFGKWYTVHTLKGVRWQSLRVVEERPLNRSIILMTCEALSGSVQLFVVGQDGSVLRTWDLSNHYNLREKVRSPSVACVDDKRNLLVVDYTDGNVYLVSPAENNPGVRVTRAVTTTGAMGSLGMTCTDDGWCFIACLPWHRVIAVRYLAAASTQSAQMPRRALSTYDGPRCSSTTPNTPVTTRKLQFHDNVAVADA